MDKDKPRRLATIREATKYAKVGKTTLYRLIAEGRIIAVRLDGRRLVDLNSIDRLHANLPEISKVEQDAHDWEELDRLDERAGFAEELPL